MDGSSDARARVGEKLRASKRARVFVFAHRMPPFRPLPRAALRLSAHARFPHESNAPMTPPRTRSNVIPFEKSPERRSEARDQRIGHLRKGIESGEFRIDIESIADQVIIDIKS